MSGFRVNTNVTALSAMRNLSVNDRAQTRSMEKLSSGLRINRAADDAAGLAISERFRTQVNGINQGIKNIQDGISLLQVAEGGLSTIGDMIQRIRTLAVQSANDTLTDADRSLIQLEVDQLLTEVDRQASTVNFNNKVLLTGQYSGISSPVGAPVAQTFDSVGVVTADARPNYYRTSFADPTAVAAEPAAGAEFTGAQYTLASAVEGFVFDQSTGIVGNNAGMRFQFQPGVVANDITQIDFRFRGGSDANGVSPDNVVMQLYDFQNSAWVTVGNNGGDILGAVADVTGSPGGTQSRFADVDGDIWAQAYVATDVAPAGSTTIRVDYASLSVTTQAKTSTASLKIQAGANKGETIDVTLPDARRAALGLAGLSVATRSNAETAITTASNALTRINGSRAEIGAYQNRLERSMNFEEIQVENQSAAESRIRDLDFSEEIVAFTKQQILQQAGVSALAQANVAPQAVLQLLK